MTWAVAVVVAIAFEPATPVAATAVAIDEPAQTTAAAAVRPLGPPTMCVEAAAADVAARQADAVASTGETAVGRRRRVRCDCLCCGCCGYGSTGRDLPICWPGRAGCRAALQSPRSTRAAEAAQRLVEVVQTGAHAHRPSAATSRAASYCAPAAGRLSNSRHH